MAQLMSRPLTVSCLSKIQIGFTFLLPADPGSPGQRAVKQVCVCVTVYAVLNVMCLPFCCYVAVQQKRCRANMLPVAFGDRVLAKHKNGRYYHAIVLSVSDVVYYKVAFDDGSYSNDMYPEDIEVSKTDCFIVTLMI